MKKFYIAAGAFALFMLGSGLMPKSLNARINGSNIGANYSGITGTTCNTSGCHVGALNSGPGGVAITTNVPGTGYIPGTEYSITITVDAGGANGNVFGFACSAAKDGSTTPTGGFSAADGTTLAKSGGAYMVHNTAAAGSGASDTHTFTVNWTAPASGTGDVKIFAAGNSGNGNGQNSGDQIYNSTLVVSEAPGAGLTEAIVSAFQLFPNPATESVTLNVPDQLLDGTVRVLDMTGKTVFHTQLNMHQIAIDLTAFNQGAYIVEIQKDGKSYTSRLVKNH